MAYTATLSGVAPLDNMIQVSVDFSNGPSSLTRNYLLTPGTGAELKAQLKPLVAVDVAKLQSKENTVEAIRGLIGTQVKDL